MIGATANPKGLFLNSLRANCSIYESGKMAYDCLARSTRFSLDYQEISSKDHQIGRYDFYIVNYHHATMEWLNTAEIANLPGLKATLVLETLPNNPFALCPPGDFDVYCALDPTMKVKDKRVYAFPRPLEVPAREPVYRETPVPVIGTFGFATPGKGFELVVEAVNREFDQAIVRINIPAATFADNVTHNLHKRGYSDYLAELCRKVAQKGVQVVITNDYMTKEDLIHWCAQNTLNCFLYNRMQPGLAATTDQAISSKRPLAVSTNETFRHIHPYVLPYPRQSLKESIKSSLPGVVQMQKAWTPENFAKRFAHVLEDQGFLTKKPRPPAHSQAVEEPKDVILVVSHPAKHCGIAQYGFNIVEALNKSSRYAFVLATCANPEELEKAVRQSNPCAIVYNYYPATMPWLNSSVTRKFAIPQLGLMHEVTQADADRATQELFDFHLCPDPTLAENSPFVFKTKRLIPPYINVQPLPHVITIGSFGFGFGNKGFERLVSTVQDEFDEAIILLHMPFNQIVDPGGQSHALATASRCRAAVRKPGIRLLINHKFLDQQELLDLLAKMTINVFLYAEDRIRGISSVVDSALAVQRPIALSRCGMFRHVVGASPSIFIEDASLRQIIQNDIEPLVPYYNDWSEAAFIFDYERILDTILVKSTAVKQKNANQESAVFVASGISKRRGENHVFPKAPIPQSLEALSASKPKTLDLATPGTFNRILGDDARSFYEPVIQQLSGLVPDMMARKIPEANVQQAFVFDTVRRFAGWYTAPKMLCVGSFEDTAAASLKILDYRLEAIDPAENYDLNTFFHLPTTVKGSYDLIFSTSVLEHVKDDALFVTQLAELLAPGGTAILTVDYNDNYRPGDRIPQEDFRFYTQKDLIKRLFPMLKGCSLVDRPRWECPEPDFTYAGCHYTFASFVFQKTSERKQAINIETLRHTPPDTPSEVSCAADLQNSEQSDSTVVPGSLRQIIRTYLKVLGRQPQQDELGSWQCLINNGIAPGEIEKVLLNSVMRFNSHQSIKSTETGI